MAKGWVFKSAEVEHFLFFDVLVSWIYRLKAPTKFSIKMIIDEQMLYFRVPKARRGVFTPSGPEKCFFLSLIVSLFISFPKLQKQQQKKFEASLNKVQAKLDRMMTSDSFLALLDCSSLSFLIYIQEWGPRAHFYFHFIMLVLLNLHPTTRHPIPLWKWRTCWVLI